MTREIIIAGSATCDKAFMLEQRAKLLKKQGKKVKVVKKSDMKVK